MPSTTKRVRVKASIRRLFTPIQLSAISISTRSSDGRTAAMGSSALVTATTSSTGTCSSVLPPTSTAATAARTPRGSRKSRDRSVVVTRPGASGKGRCKGYQARARPSVRSQHRALAHAVAGAPVIGLFTQLEAQLDAECLASGALAQRVAVRRLAQF